MTHKKHHGFTLIELSIVLIIVGLIVSGVIVAQTLIQSAQLRSVLGDIERFNTAALTFKTKYNQLPGDYSEAAAIWGAKPDCINTPAMQTQTVTCSGNNNSRIDGNETYWFWQHLTNAALIPGQYGGGWNAIGDVDTDPDLDLYVPKLRMRGILVGLYYEGGGSIGFENWFTDVRRNIFLLMGNNMQYLTVSPEEGFYLDSKTDDGRPGLGRTRVRMIDLADPTTCVTTTVASTAYYNIEASGNNVACGQFVISAAF